MEAKREQAFVGLFVLVVAALLITTLFILNGSFNKGDIPYHAYFKNAGGMAPGTEVRYAGGPPMGRVSKVQVDPLDATRMKVDFSVNPSVPVKTDSTALITSTSPLGENFLGIKPGTNAAPRAPSGYTLKSVEYTGFSDIADQIAGLTPSAQQLLANLNDRVTTLKVTLDRVNDLLNDQNRANISASLGDVRGMLKEDRPLVHSTLGHVNEGTENLKPLVASFQKTADQANDTLLHLDGMLTENRPDIRQAVLDLHKALDQANSVLGSLNETVSSNQENLDDIIDNLRHVTENLNAFTETIKTRPYTLIRASEPKEHQPGSDLPK
jgi:phospholipid/cholesterol/gamma-HCH transport system substrate-binding protein